MLVPVGDHCAAPVPSPSTHDVHPGGQEGVGVANHGADVEVVFPVLDSHVEWVSTGVQVGDDGLHRPISVAVGHVASVAAGQQFRVEPMVVGPRLGVGPYPDRGVFPASRGAGSGHSHSTIAWLTRLRRSQRNLMWVLEGTSWARNTQ